ncbi:MAG TPA: hypothetical protein VIB39_02185 [Candidatus Angelobacter sp.]|jgi:hypothetical protein
MKRFCILLVMFLATAALIAQDTPPAKDTTPKKDVPGTVKGEAAPTYRFAFSIYELVEGKRTNQRDYSLLVQADGRGPNSKIKIGTKVPIVTGNAAGNTQYTYTDVGVDLECSAIETTNNKLAVGIELGFSSFATANQNADAHSEGLGPVFRAISQHLRSVLTPGKPLMLTSVDDPNSNKRFQVEVTATKVE